MQELDKPFDGNGDSLWVEFEFAKDDRNIFEEFHIDLLVGDTDGRELKPIKGASWIRIEMTPDAMHVDYDDLTSGVAPQYSSEKIAIYKIVNR